MRWARILVAGVTLLAGACSSEPEGKAYEMQGQILSVRPERNEVVIRHDDIKGFMPGMTMPFKVKNPALLQGREAGDLITATLVVGEVEAYLSTLTRTGSAPLAPEIEVTATEGAVLQPGDLLPDQPLIDQKGRVVRLSSYLGHRLALTFIYTRCPLPEFCPLMDRHFASVQRTIKETPALRDVRLLSISFDPAYDTPPVLDAHAATLGADPAVWTFATATPEEMTRLISRFGMIVEHDPQQAIDITHNLRTAIIDANGRVAAVHSGTDWTPGQLVAELTAAPAPAR